MLTARNNPAVSLSTRRWAVGLAREGLLLDESSWRVIERILLKTAAVHPGGLVHAAARMHGAPEEHALIAASACEMFYGGCSAGDDLQDGDTDAYLDGVPFSLRLNAQVHLLSLVEARLQDLPCGSEMDRPRPFSTLAAMLTGQRMEILRNPWNIDVYERVARLSAGEQFSFYLHTAACAAGCSINALRGFGYALGTLLQVIADLESGDERFIAFPQARRDNLLHRLIEEVQWAVRPLGGLLDEQVKELLLRCPPSAVSGIHGSSPSMSGPPSKKVHHSPQL